LRQNIGLGLCGRACDQGRKTEQANKAVKNKVSHEDGQARKSVNGGV